MASDATRPATDASRHIDARIAEYNDWRGTTLSAVRALILAADAEIVEEWKWNVPVWSRGGIVCTGEVYKATVKLTFAKGASLPDPAGLFNSSLEGKVRRAIDIREGETVDARAFKALIKAAAGPKLLSGGNPQIAKADGDTPVQAYIAAMPGWKRDLGLRLDTLITSAVPKVRKAVKWNSPFYGIEGKGWFLSFHVYTKFVKVAFFNGASLKPIPPGDSKSENTRYLNIHETDTLDETQFKKWVKQAAALPGWGT